MTELTTIFYSMLLPVSCGKVSNGHLSATCTISHDTLVFFLLVPTVLYTKNQSAMKCCDLKYKESFFN